MVVNKLLILILSVTFINLNLFPVNNALEVETIGQYGSIISGKNNDKNYWKQSHADYKRAKREDDTARGNYILNGYHENGTIPVKFPLDICLFELSGILYASALHFSTQPQPLLNQSTILTIFKNVENGVFVEIFTHETQSAKDMDCLAFNGTGYVAITNTIERDVEDMNHGSPVLQVAADDSVHVVQYFSMPFQNKVYLRRYGNNLYMMQLFLSQTLRPNVCPIFKWSSNHFDLIDEPACTNAMKMEQFDIESDIYVALANNRDEFGETATFSYIYKYSLEHRKYFMHQQIRTNAAVDVSYFRINDEHFLVFANSYEKLDNGEKNFETQSIIYKHIDDYFTPFQTILLDSVAQIRPVMGPQSEFVLLISCEGQPTKSWQYNGWQFYESDIQFTGGALSTGVSEIRTYWLQGSVALVVANPSMFKDASNLFFPQFTLKEQPRILQQTVERWCDANKLEPAVIESAKSLAIDLGRLPMRNIPDEQNVNEINFLEEVTIDTITTKLLNMQGMTVDQQLTNRISEMIKLIENLNKRLAALESPTTNINTMADQSKSDTTFQNDENTLQSESQIVGQDNEHPTENKLDVVELDELTIGEMIVMDFVNGHPFADLVFVNRDLNVSEVVVNELILENHRNYMEIIGKANKHSDLREDMVEAASESFVSPLTGVVETMKVNSLIVDGFINRLDLSMLNEFALKIRGDQVIDSEINFEELQAASLLAEVVSNKQINDIVRTIDGPFTVTQSIQFTSPVSINELNVNRRINNINVVKGGFNVLLKRSDHHEQVITALKVFDEVKLLNPIILQGKILKSNLDKINPIVSFTDDIVLEGDYELRGNTTIIRVIRGENFYGSGGVYNAKDLLTDGLRLDTPVIEQIFDFVQPIKVTNLVSRSVNNVDVSKFIRTGEIQTVYGEKIFTGDLHVTNGVCEAFVINDVDLSLLNSAVLKRTGDQRIDGKINFNSIRVKRATAKTISLFGHKFSDYLTKTDQIITGNVTIKGNLIVNTIQIENIRTNNKICGYDLGAMIADTFTTTAAESSNDIIITGEKVFENQLTLENVQIGGNVFQLGTMESLLGYLSMINDDVKLNGPITLANVLRVAKLTFTQSINGISSSDFGYQWLLSETDQDFIAPQTIYTIKTDENVVLNGSFNNVDLVSLYGITQFKNQPITFKNATFARAIFQQPVTVNGLVSGISFPNDIVLKDADYLQSISTVSVDDINVSGKITVEGKINSIDYNIACDLLLPDVSPYALILERDATFDHAPQIENLNEQNVNQLYSDVWLSNKNTELTGIPTFSHVEFSKPIEIKGLLNGFDIGYLSYHYVSLTKPQEIVAEVEVNGNVLFQGDIRIGSIQMNGVIKDPNSGRTYKIDDFDRNVLKKDIDQVITGEWFIADVNVAGDINTLVNGLNLVTDVARYSNAINNVTSSKSFESVAVRNVNCQYGCTLMDVDVIDWVSKVVFLSGNYTIQGTTVMEAPLFYNNLYVMGLVNNLTFTPENILLKSSRQNINGNVYISNKSVNDNRILPLSFVDVQLESINGKSISDFYLNIVYRDIPLAISTRVEFNEPLTVDYLRFDADINGRNMNELIRQFQLYQVVTNYSEHLEHMNIIGDAIVDELKIKRNYLATYRLQQVIFGNIKKIISVEVATTTELFDVFVMLNVTDVNGFLNFYIFDRETSVLALANSLFGFKPKDMHIVDIFSLRISDRDFLIVQTQNHFSGAFGHSFFTHFRGQFRTVYEIHGNVSREIVGLIMGTDDCFITYSRHATNVAIACAFFTEPGILAFQQVDELYFSSGVVQVRTITSTNRVEIIVLDMEGKISVWSLDQQHKFARSQIIKTLHTTTHISVAQHKDFHYIAACSETSLTSTHMGSIDIYISSANAYVNMQSIVIESPIRIELSVVASTNDLVLYVLTDTVAKPLVVYRHSGVTKFTEFTAGVTIPRAQRLNVLKAKVLGKELISLISEGLGGLIIEAIVK